MGFYIGDFLEDAIVPLGAFTTNAADGGRESLSASLEEADIIIYSDDGDGTYTAMTLDANTIVITENPGSLVGVYLVAVDMSNDADFVTGKDYIAVFYPDETVDSQEIAGVLGHWSCENRSVDVARWATNDVTASSGNPDVNVESIDDIDAPSTWQATLQALITGGSYALDTDANGRVRIVDGTGAGELDTSSGLVQLLAATQASIDAIEADTNELQGDDIPGVIAALNNLSTGDVDARLEAIGLDHLLSASVTGTDVTDDSLFAMLVSKEATADWDDFVNTTDSLQAIRDRGDASWITATGFSTHNAASVWAVATRVLTAGTNLNDLSQADIRSAIGLTSANLDTQLDALPTQSEITGGSYSLDTDANGRMRIVDGTGAGELDTSSGWIAGIAGTKNTLDDLNDITVANVYTTQMTESYAANGVAPTLAQSQFAIHQMLMQFAIAGTSLTVRELDNTTTAFVVTLDDATNPTSAVRT
jgi:hypothetical protein